MSDENYSGGTRSPIATRILVIVAVIGGSIIFIFSQGFFDSNSNPTDIEYTGTGNTLETNVDSGRFSGEILTTIQERIDFHVLNTDERWNCILYSQSFRSYVECAGLGNVEDHSKEVAESWTPYEQGETLDYEFTIDFDRITTFTPYLENEIKQYFNAKLNPVAKDYGIEWNQEIDGTVTFWWQYK